MSDTKKRRSIPFEWLCQSHLYLRELRWIYPARSGWNVDLLLTKARCHVAYRCFLLIFMLDRYSIADKIQHSINRPLSFTHLGAWSVYSRFPLTEIIRQYLPWFLVPYTRVFIVANLVLALMSFLMFFSKRRWWQDFVVSFIVAWIWIFDTIDQYQHHYLVVLVWFIIAISWMVDTDIEQQLLASRLLSLQMAIVYMFAIYHKFTWHYLNGSILRFRYIHDPNFRITFLFESIAVYLPDGYTDQTLWALLSIGGPVIEFVLFTSLLLNWETTSFLVGVLFHLIIQSMIRSGSIGWFTHLLLCFYILYAPVPIISILSVLIGIMQNIPITLISLFARSPPPPLPPPPKIRHHFVHLEF